MELGNIIFGNSRGQYPIKRHIGYEDELKKLFIAIDPDYDGYGVDYENDIVFLMLYYWGDCTCGYDEKEWKWSEENKHRADCYQLEYRKTFGYSYKVNYSELKKLYKKYGWDTKGKDWWHGCDIRCSCDYDARWKQFISENDHTSHCPIIKPNFLYKPTGLEIQWYKYPLRDAYFNQDISLNEFKDIIDDCIKSVEY